MSQAAMTSKIPTLENSATKLLIELSDADVSMDMIVQLVEMSPSIAAKLVSSANSAWSNPVAPVTSIPDACSRLGLNVVRTTTIALAIGQSFDSRRCPSFDAEKFWCTSIISSNLAAELAATTGDEPNTSRTAALLHNIGLLWLADSMPNETNESLMSASETPDRTISDCLRTKCGFDRQQASLYLFDAWKLPAALTGGWEAGDSKDSDLIARCETMATKIYNEIPVEESGCPSNDDAIVAAYEGQLRDLQKIRDMSSALI